MVLHVIKLGDSLPTVAAKIAFARAAPTALAEVDRDWTLKVDGAVRPRTGPHEETTAAVGAVPGASPWAFSACSREMLTCRIPGGGGGTIGASCVGPLRRLPALEGRRLVAPRML